MTINLTTYTHNSITMRAFALRLQSIEQRETKAEKVLTDSELEDLENNQTLVNPTANQIAYLVEYLTGEIKAGRKFANTLEKFAEDLEKITK